MDATITERKSGLAPCSACGTPLPELSPACEECGIPPEFPEWALVASGRIWKDRKTSYLTAIYRKRESFRVVLHEGADNPGMSVTNAIEEIATRVFQYLRERAWDVRPEDVEWFEKCEKDKRPPEKVCMTWAGEKFAHPVWAPHEAFDPVP